MAYKTILTLLFCLGGICASHATQPVIDMKAIQAIGTSTTTISGAVEKFGIQQFAELTNHTSQLTQTVSSLETQIKQLQSQLDAMTANLSRAAGFDSLVEDLAANLLPTSTSFEHRYDRKTKKKLDPKKKEHISVMVDQLFVPANTSNRFNYKKVKESYQQRAYKGALEFAEVVINNAPDRAEEIGYEVMKINVTNQLKDSVDVNSRLVGELLVEQQKTNMLLAQLVKTSASEKFYGLVENATVGNETYQSRARKKAMSGTPVEDVTLPSGRRGYDPFKESSKERRKREREEEKYSPFIE